MKRVLSVIFVSICGISLTFLQPAYAGLIIQDAADDWGVIQSENTIAGSYCNRLYSPGLWGATIAGGGYVDTDSNTCYANIVGGHYGTVSGGVSNMSWSYATVTGGYGNEAVGSYSWAGGRMAKSRNSAGSVIHSGTFVWADSNHPNAGQDFYTVADNEFAVRARGGVRLITNVDAGGGPTNSNVSIDPGGSISFGSTTRQMLNLYDNTYGIGVQNYRVYFRTAPTTSPKGGFVWFSGGAHSDTTNDPGTGGSVLMELTPDGLWVNGSFAYASDRSMKQDFREIYPTTILRKVADMPMAEWSFRNAPETRHLGPAAQDFYAAFGLGRDDKTITVADAQGVAFAAIQGLNQLLRDQRSEIEALTKSLSDREGEIRALKQAMIDISGRLEALEISGKTAAAN